MQPPLRHVFVHDRDEAIVMMPLDEMSEFVDDEIFQALHLLLGELEVQPDATGLCIAGAPLGLHLLDAPRINLNAQGRLPYFQKGRNQFLELLAIPTLQHSLSLLSSGLPPRMEFDGGFVAHDNFRCPTLLADAKAVTLAEKIVALAADHLPFGLARLAVKSRLLTLYPPKLSNHRQSHGVIVHSLGCRHTDTAVGGIYAQVQVLDVLPNNLNPQAIDGYPMVFSTHADSSRAQGFFPQDHRSARRSPNRTCSVFLALGRCFYPLDWNFCSSYRIRERL